MKQTYKQTHMSRMLIGRYVLSAYRIVDIKLTNVGYTNVDHKLTPALLRCVIEKHLAQNRHE
jgi:hypothetical protein